MADTPIGFVGIGAMGKPMAINIRKASLPVIVTDPNQTATSILAQHGAEVAANARAVADRAAVVHACLPSVKIAEAVAAEAAEGSAIRYFINHGTTGSAYSKAAASMLAAKGVQFLDAPISGGVAGSEAGTLAIMCSGSREAFEVAKPGLEAMSGQLTFLGDQPGAAQVMKLCNNILFFCNFAATLETMTLGAKAGLDPEQMLTVFNKATGRNFATERIIGPNILTRQFDFGGANYIIEKDMELWRQEAEAYGVPGYIGVLVRTLFRQMVEQEGRNADLSHLTLLMEQMAGTQIPKTR
jgi:3-hydroxyisobutyrate dehydrogenase-like beta-hydroxyacid dehydrogenase